MPPIAAPEDYASVQYRFDGTQRRTLASPPDAWGGRALVQWARTLARSARFDPEVRSVVDVAKILDRIYGR